MKLLSKKGIHPVGILVVGSVLRVICVTINQSYNNVQL